MKLTEIAIDGYKGTQHTQLQNIGSGLNVILSSTAATRQSISSFILDILYGPDRNATPTTVWPNGHLHVQSGGQHYQLARPQSEHLGELAISDLHTSHTGHRTPKVLSQLDHSTFGTFFNIPLDRANWNWPNFVSQLVSQFNLSGQSYSGDMPFATDQDSFKSWKRGAETRLARHDSLRREIQALTNERDRLQAEQHHQSNEYRQRLLAIENELADLQSRYDSLTNTLNAERNRLQELDHQINELTRFIEVESSRVQHVPVARPATNFLELFYERLDEVDNQIRRWRSVQSDIQDQRLRLRDEMVSHGELSIESHDHPYHDAREITIALEKKIEHTELLARNWEQSHSPAENERQLTSLCHDMRKDLQALCSELGRQYKHVRHKATVAELKQLRRCYHEMDENVKRLLVRRESIINEIRQLDPAGAEAIMRGDQQFTMAAEQQGFMAARQRFVTGQPVPETQTATEYRTIYPDVTAEQTQLRELQSNRQSIVDRLRMLESELQGFDPRRTALIEERNRLSAFTSQNNEQRLREIQSALASMDQELRSLQIQIDADKPWLNWQPNYLLTDASRFLRLLTSDRLHQVWIDAGQQVSVSNNSNNSIAASTLAVADQALVRLSLSLAAIEQLALRGVRLPILIEDTENLTANIQLIPTVASFCRNGHQVILLTGNPRLIEEGRKFQGTIFELPDTNITSPNWYPDPQSTPMPRHDFPASPAPPTSHYRTNYSTPVTPDIGNSFMTDMHPHQVDHSTTAWQPTPATYRPSPARSLTPVTPPAARPTQRPIQRPTTTRRESTFEPTPVVSAPRTACTRKTMLQDIDLVESIYLTPIESLGIRTVGQLLDMDLDQQSADLSRRGFNLDQIDRWQAQAWLMICLPELSSSESRVLVGSGVDQPELILQLGEADILERIRRYLESTAGRHSNTTYSQFSSQRIRGWSNRLRNDNGWRTFTRSRSRNRGSSSRSARTSSSSSRSNNRVVRNSGTRQSVTPQIDLSPNNNLPARQITRTRTSRNPAESRSIAPRTSNHVSATETRTKTVRNKTTKTGKQTQSRYRFYLNMSDDIEAAPSIGPKAAEKFYAIGIHTVSDFVNSDATDMAAQLENRRMSAKTLTIWQKQSRLMCAVPNLRGHDVQILVACDICEANELANMDPHALLDIVLPFVKTKEGVRILRNGKKPDLEEVTEWIDAANNVRSLKAA